MNKKIILGVIVVVVGFMVIFGYKGFSDKSPIAQNDIIIDKKDGINQNENIRKNGPNVKIDQMFYDFGVVKYGDIAEHIFEITNTGTENLEIIKLSTSCGCTKASVADEDKIIIPGESVNMIVTFDPAVHKDDSDLGELQRIVYIRTNDPKNEETEVEIKANVIKPEKFITINVTAQQWFFSPDPVKVKQGDYVELKLTSADVSHGFVLSDFNIDAQINPGEETIIKFLADKKGLFEFYCSIPCGGGHSRMRGKFVVE